MANSSGSKLYEKFLQTLGQEVDLATHRGFNGRYLRLRYDSFITSRLDSKRLSNGRYFPYFADDHVEVMKYLAVLDSEASRSFFTWQLECQLLLMMTNRLDPTSKCDPDPSLCVRLERSVISAMIISTSCGQRTGLLVCRLPHPHSVETIHL